MSAKHGSIDLVLILLIYIFGSIYFKFASVGHVLNCQAT